MKNASKELENIQQEFQVLRTSLENKATSLLEETKKLLVEKMGELIDKARIAERAFLCPSNYPLSVEIYDTYKKARIKLGLDTTVWYP